MSADTPDDLYDDHAHEPPVDVKSAGAEARGASRRRRSTTGSSKRRRGEGGAKTAAAASEDTGERLREQAADVLAATRERIVERPLQAVLVAAAAGAFAALLLGATRR